MCRGMESRALYGILEHIRFLQSSQTLAMMCGRLMKTFMLNAIKAAGLSHQLLIAGEI